MARAGASHWRLPRAALAASAKACCGGAASRLAEEGEPRRGEGAGLSAPQGRPAEPRACAAPPGQGLGHVPQQAGPGSWPRAGPAGRPEAARASAAPSAELLRLGERGTGDQGVARPGDASSLSAWHHSEELKPPLQGDAALGHEHMDGVAQPPASRTSTSLGKLVCECCRGNGATSRHLELATNASLALNVNALLWPRCGCTACGCNATKQGDDGDDTGRQDVVSPHTLETTRGLTGLPRSPRGLWCQAVCAGPSAFGLHLSRRGHCSICSGCMAPVEMQVSTCSTIRLDSSFGCNRMPGAALQVACGMVATSVDGVAG
mmetsp:Transcript_47578/g.146995  ORF Transcript_47578/g.146995 Transcript_47578/m.146995 type:complete len:320 (+) Transcript_47578:1014-1973(+)